MMQSVIFSDRNLSNMKNWSSSNMDLHWVIRLALRPSPTHEGLNSNFILSKSKVTI